MSNVIAIRGARQHNLKDVAIDIPRERLVVITGLSGSGKSSLAFDTLYAEGQRRYVESLSAYARQFLEQLEKPDVDAIEGLSPAIAIEQKTVSRNPRSTVGTVTEIYDYLRLLFARVGVPYCPQCGQPIRAQTVQNIVDRVLQLPVGHPPVHPRAGGAAPQGGVPQGAGADQARRLRARAHRRRGRGARHGSPAGPQLQSHHRDRCRPARRAVRHGRAPDQFRRDRSGPQRRPGRRAGRGRRAPAVQRPARLPGLRLQLPGAGAAAVFVQQPAGRLHHLRRVGRRHGVRPRTGGAARRAVAQRGRCGRVVGAPPGGHAAPVARPGGAVRRGPAAALRTADRGPEARRSVRQR